MSPTLKGEVGREGGLTGGAGGGADLLDEPDRLVQVDPGVCGDRECRLGVEPRREQARRPPVEHPRVLGAEGCVVPGVDHAARLLVSRWILRFSSST